MKKLKYILAITLMTMFVGCEEYEDDLAPKAEFELSKTSVNTFEVIELTNKGFGEFYTIYTGAEGNEYVNRGDGATGIPGNQQGNASFSYDAPGVYEVAFVVSSYADGEILESVDFQTVIVNDTDGSLEKISFNQIGQIERVGNSTGSFFSVEARPDDSNVIKFEMLNFRHFGFENRSDIELVPEFILGSSSATIEIESNPNYEFGGNVNHVNFEQKYVSRTYSVQPVSASAQEFLVGVVEIPEFDEFSLNGIQAINRIHPSNNNIFFLSAPVSMEDELTNLTPNIGLFFDDETTVMVEGAPYNNGALNFSGIVPFELSYQMSSGETEFTSDSEIFVKAMTAPMLEEFAIENVSAIITLEEEGNPSIYFVDLILPESEIPDGQTANQWLGGLVPDFEITEGVGSIETSIRNEGTQVSGETQVNFSAYFNEYASNPGSFELDNLRKQYQIERSIDLETDSITYEKAFSLTTIYKIAVIVE